MPGPPRQCAAAGLAVAIQVAIATAQTATTRNAKERFMVVSSKLLARSDCHSIWYATHNRRR